MADLLIVNTIEIDDNHVDKIMDAIEEITKHEVSMQQFDVSDGEGLMLFRNGDFFEPDPESPDGRF